MSHDWSDPESMQRVWMFEWRLDWHEWGLEIAFCTCPGISLRLGPLYWSAERW